MTTVLTFIAGKESYGCRLVEDDGTHTYFPEFFSQA